MSFQRKERTPSSLGSVLNAFWRSERELSRPCQVLLHLTEACPRYCIPPAGLTGSAGHRAHVVWTPMHTLPRISCPWPGDDVRKGSVTSSDQ